jgi:hypothetical protein
MRVEFLNAAIVDFESLSQRVVEALKIILLNNYFLPFLR